MQKDGFDEVLYEVQECNALQPPVPVQPDDALQGRHSAQSGLYAEQAEESC